MRKYLKFRGGFFVEAGAHDGISQSNTYYYEKYLGWRGILVEAMPQLYQSCGINRPRAQVVNCALVSSAFPDDVIEMTFCGLMSVVKGGMGSAEEEQEHVTRGCEIQKLESYSLTVPARTLTNVLSELKVEKIDLLSLDVEGYELDVLKGLDLDRFKPKYMLIEARYRQDIDAHLNGRYETVAELSRMDVLYRAI